MASAKPITITAAVAIVTAGGPPVCVVLDMPAGSYERYMGTSYTVVGTGTGGTIDSFLTKDAQLYRAYADRQPIDGAA